MTSADPVDLLVFGPHPDDLEIGMAGTIAKHTSLGHRVGLCDLTEGEMGSNGTVAERRAEAEAAAAALGACWRVNLGLPDRAIGSEPRPCEPGSGAHSAGAPAERRAALLVRPASGSRRRQRDADRGGLQRRAAPVSRRRRGLEAGVDVLLLHQRPHCAILRRGRQRPLRHQAARAGLPRQPVRATRVPTPSRRG